MLSTRMFSKRVSDEIDHANHHHPTGLGGHERGKRGQRVHINEYHYLDAAAALLSSMLNRFGGLELKQSADIVRRTWDDRLTLLIRAESVPHIEQFVCVAWTSLDRSEAPHITMGTAAEIAKVCPPSDTAPCLIPMQLLLRCLRGNAARAGITLPARLTVDPNDKAAYAHWRRQIDDYRQAAGTRVAKLAKPLAPA